MLTTADRSDDPSTRRFVLALLAGLALAIGTVALPPTRAGAEPTPTTNPSPAPDDLWRPPAGSTPATGSYLYLTGRWGYEQEPMLFTSDEMGLTAWLPSETGLARANASFGGSDGEHRARVQIAGLPDSTTLAPGWYQEVGSYESDMTRGLLDMTIGSQSCHSGSGWFAVDEATYDGLELTALRARFAYRCKSYVEVRGEVRWTIAPHIDTVTPRSGPRRGGTVLTLSGRDLVAPTSATVGGVPAEVTANQFGTPQVVTPELPFGTWPVAVVTAGGATSTTGELAHFTATANPPGLVEDLVATAGEASASVTWTLQDPGDAPLTGLELTVLGHGSQQSVDLPVDATSHTFTGLHPGGVYRVDVTYENEAGRGLTTTSAAIQVPPPDPTPFEEIDELIEQLLRDFGAGPVSAQARDQIRASIEAGRATPPGLAALLSAAPAWGGARSPIIRLYQAYFLRLPDPAGLEYWARRAARGTSIHHISASFAASSEFRTRYGALDDGEFVDLVYRNVLERPADPGGRSYWARRLAAGTSRGLVMTHFSESSENTRRTKPVTESVEIYTAMVHRVPTEAELDATGTLGEDRRREQIAAAVLRGGEYAGRF